MWLIHTYIGVRLSLSSRRHWLVWTQCETRWNDKRPRGDLLIYAVHVQCTCIIRLSAYRNLYTPTLLTALLKPCGTATDRDREKEGDRNRQRETEEQSDNYEDRDRQPEIERQRLWKIETDRQRDGVEYSTNQVQSRALDAGQFLTDSFVVCWLTDDYLLRKSHLAGVFTGLQ